LAFKPKVLRPKEEGGKECATTLNRPRHRLTNRLTFVPNAAICEKIAAALWSIAKNAGLYFLAMSTTFAGIARGTAGGAG
jgi:hypothetical protein